MYTQVYHDLKKQINNLKDINENIYDGNTILILVAREGFVDLVDMLLAAGAYIDQTNNYSHTAIMMAARYGHNGCVRRLIQAGGDVNKVTRLGDTALKLAAIDGHVACIKTLLEAGVDVNHKNKYNECALSCSLYGDDLESVIVLLQAGAEIESNMKFRVNCAEYMKDTFQYQTERWYPELTPYYPTKFKETMEALLLWYNKTDILPLELIFEIGVQLSQTINNL